MPTSPLVRTVTVNAPAITVTANGRVGSGLVDTNYTVSLGAPGHGGVTVRLQSSNGFVLRVGPNNVTTAGTDFIDVFVPNGTTNFAFSIHGMENQTGTVTLTASAPGFTNGTAAATVAPPVIEVLTMPTSTTAGAANSNVVLRSGVSQTSNVNAIANEQAPRPGGVPLEITVTNSIAAVAQLQVIGGAAGQSVTITMPSGSTRTSNGAPGGLQIDPLGPGTTTVTFTAPGFNPTAGVARTLIVN